MADTEFKFPDEQVVNDKDNDDVSSEYEIEVQDDTPVEDRGRKPLTKVVDDPSDDELQEYSEKVKIRIKELTHARHDERRAKELLQREKEEAFTLAQNVLSENKKLQQRIAQGENSYVSQAQHFEEVKLSNAKAAFITAHESGDTTALLEAQIALNAAQNRLDKIKSFKPTPLPKEEDSVNVPPQQTQQTPVPAVDQKAQAWRGKNPWFGEDEEMTSFALGLHNKLVKSGYDTASDEYYDAINNRMKQIFPQEFPSEIKESPSKKPATVVAPSSRSSSAKKIVLTQTQVNIAKRLGVPLELYAKQVAVDARKQNG